MVEEVPQVDPLHLQASLQDPGGTERFGRSTFKPERHGAATFSTLLQRVTKWRERRSTVPPADKASQLVFLKRRQANRLQNEMREDKRGFIVRP